MTSKHKYRASGSLPRPCRPFLQRSNITSGLRVVGCYNYTNYVYALFSVKCAPGTYSGNGVEPCTPCAKGSYQTGIGALSCVECTGGKSTYGPGADAADMCVGKILLN